MVNQKSDVAAKTTFIAELLRRGYSNARVTRQPADITAEKDGKTYFFEIKSTSAEKSYFGAATLTEWEAAIRNEDRYRFVVAIRRDDVWMFREYTPEQFMEFSSLPPFKIFFHLPLDEIQRVGGPKRRSARVQVKRCLIEELVLLFARLKSEV